MELTDVVAALAEAGDVAAVHAIVADAAATLTAAGADDRTLQALAWCASVATGQLGRRGTAAGMLDRAGFVLSAERVRALAARGGGGSALLIVTVEGLGQVREFFGAREADQLVRDAGILLTRTLREVDVVGRSDADRFLALMPDCADVAGVTRRLHDAAATWARSPAIHLGIEAVDLPLADDRALEVVLMEHAFA